MTFFKLTTDMAKEIRGIHLTAAEWKIWSYLVTLAPFGDRYMDAPDMFVIMTECGVSKSAVYRAMAKFQEHGLFDFQAHIRFRNLRGEKSASNLRKSSEEKIVPELGIQSQNWESNPRTGNEISNLGKSAAETTIYQDSRSLKTNKNFKSSSDLIGEEDFKFEEKQIQEVDQVKEINRQSTALAATDTLLAEVQQKGSSDIHPASLIEKPRLRNEAIDPSIDNPPPAESLNGDLEIDQDLLLWVMEVKLPTMKLNTQPVNVEAYAKGMLRRDGEKLQAEYADVVAGKKFLKKVAELTVQVESRVREWQKVSHAELTVYHDLEEGMPMVMLDGISIGAVDFLAKPVQPAPMVATIPFSPENREARFSRTSRLKLSSKINENPGFEFLEQCWEDFFLRPQVTLALAKHPDWAVVREGKLCSGASH